tara:strand:- start:369 stop:644 length:276 start_codon:yes stop_codon:yes gene_type:complete
MKTTNNTEKVTIKHTKSYSNQNIYSVSLLADYILIHEKNGYTNVYTLNTKVMGLKTGSLWLDVLDVNHENNNNQEILTYEEVKTLFEDNIR